MTPELNRLVGELAGRLEADRHWQARMEQKTDQQMKAIIELQKSLVGLPHAVDDCVDKAICEHEQRSHEKQSAARRTVVTVVMLCALAAAGALNFVGVGGALERTIAMMAPLLVLAGWHFVGK